jgi:beta-glucosidase
MDDQAAGADSIRDAMRERYYGEWLRLTAEHATSLASKTTNERFGTPRGPSLLRPELRATVWELSCGQAPCRARCAMRLP